MQEISLKGKVTKERNPKKEFGSGKVRLRDLFEYR
jgi:hypothetical protein